MAGVQFHRTIISTSLQMFHNQKKGCSGKICKIRQGFLAAYPDSVEQVCGSAPTRTARHIHAPRERIQVY